MLVQGLKVVFIEDTNDLSMCGVGSGNDDSSESDSRDKLLRLSARDPLRRGLG